MGLADGEDLPSDGGGSVGVGGALAVVLVHVQLRQEVLHVVIGDQDEALQTRAKKRSEKLYEEKMEGNRAFLRQGVGPKSLAVNRTHLTRPLVVQGRAAGTCDRLAIVRVRRTRTN